MTLRLTRADLAHELAIALRPYCAPECAEARATECLAVLERGGEKLTVWAALWEILGRLDHTGEVHVYCRHDAVQSVYSLYQRLQKKEA